jgi:hypothetical protein
MTVYRLIKSGELPAMRVGKHLRIRGNDVVEFLDARIIHIDEDAANQNPAKQNPAKGSPWPAA